jgi:hypothetical protein
MTALVRRSAFILVLVGLPFATLVPAQSTAPGVAAERMVTSVHPGSIAGNIYSNTFFGFSLEIPEGWKVADDAALKALTERNIEVLSQQPQGATYARNSEVDSPLLIMGEREPAKGGQHRRMLQILCTDVSERPGQLSADGFLKFEAEANIRIGTGAEYSDTLEQVTLGGREFWKVYFTRKSSILWHGAHFATIDKTHVLQFVLLSPDEEGLRQLEAVLRTLHFEMRAQ